MLSKNNRVILGIPGITLISLLIIHRINSKDTMEILKRDIKGILLLRWIIRLYLVY